MENQFSAMNSGGQSSSTGDGKSMKAVDKTVNASLPGAGVQKSTDGIENVFRSSSEPVQSRATPSQQGNQQQQQQQQSQSQKQQHQQKLQEQPPSGSSKLNASDFLANLKRNAFNSPIVSASVVQSAVQQTSVSAFSSVVKSSQSTALKKSSSMKSDLPRSVPLSSPSPAYHKETVTAQLNSMSEKVVRKVSTESLQSEEDTQPHLRLSNVRPQLQEVHQTSGKQQHYHHHLQQRQSASKLGTQYPQMMPPAVTNRPTCPPNDQSKQRLKPISSANAADQSVDVITIDTSSDRSSEMLPSLSSILCPQRPRLPPMVQSNSQAATKQASTQQQQQQQSSSQQRRSNAELTRSGISVRQYSVPQFDTSLTSPDVTSPDVVIRQYSKPSQEVQSSQISESASSQQQTGSQVRSSQAPVQQAPSATPVIESAVQSNNSPQQKYQQPQSLDSSQEQSQRAVQQPLQKEQNELNHGVNVDKPQKDTMLLKQSTIPTVQAPIVQDQKSQLIKLKTPKKRKPASELLKDLKNSPKSILKSSSKRQNKYNLVDPDGGRTKLQKIVRRSAIDELQQALLGPDNTHFDVDVTLSDSDNSNCFHFALYRGNARILEFLIEYQECKSSKMISTLMDEIWKTPSVLKSNHKWDLDYSLAFSLHQRAFGSGDSPMHDLINGLYDVICRAVEDTDSLRRGFTSDDLQFEECCRLILSKGYNVQLKNKNGQNPVQLMDFYGDLLKKHNDYLFQNRTFGAVNQLISQWTMVSTLLHNYQSLLSGFTDAPPPSLMNLLPVSSVENKIEYLNQIIRCGLDLRSADSDGNNIFHIAVAAFDVELVMYLCCISNPIKTTPMKLFSSLQRLLKTMSIEPDRNLYRYDAKLELISTCNADGDSPFHTLIRAVNCASKKSTISSQLQDRVLFLIQILLVFGLDFMVQNRRGQTALETGEDTQLKSVIADFYGRYLDSNDTEGAQSEQLKQEEPVTRRQSAQRAGKIAASQSLSSIASSNQVSPKVSSSSSLQSASSKAPRANTDDQLESVNDAPKVRNKRKRRLAASSSGNENRKDRARSIESSSSVATSVTNASRTKTPTGGFPKGLHPFSKDGHGRTKLQMKARAGILNDVQKLIELGADVNARDHAGYTPLSEAVNNGHYDVVKVLLENGADVNNHGLDGETALHEAVKRLDVDIISLLLQYGGDPFSTNHSGQIAVDFLKVASPLAPLKKHKDAVVNQIREILDQYTENSIMPMTRQRKRRLTAESSDSVFKSYSPSKKHQNVKDKEESQENMQKPVEKVASQKKASPFKAGPVKVEQKDSATEALAAPKIIQPVAAVSVKTEFVNSRKDSAASLANSSVGSSQNLTLSSQQQVAIDEQLLPLVLFSNPELSGELLVVDDYLAKVLGFNSTSKLYLKLGKSAFIRDQLRSKRIAVSGTTAQQLLQIPGNAQWTRYLESGAQLTQKCHFIPYSLFQDELLPYYVELTDMDPLDVSSMLDDSCMTEVKLN
ncbi:hypothetical protein MP228_009016 [Amoeboaphelidium protococcarum]|nr:hypothetical protein MP228_009016 [Amoeboaphelidium protococcarum]